MKLRINLTNDGAGKYALIRLDKIGSDPFKYADDNGVLHIPLEYVEWGNVDDKDEFFLVKLKDRHSFPAIKAYADSIENGDPGFAEEVREMLKRSGMNSRWCKDPD